MGSVVFNACRIVEDRLAPGAKGEEVRRRKAVCSDGEGGEGGEPDAVRVCDTVTASALVDRAMPFETIRDFCEGGEVDMRRGDEGRAIEFLGDDKLGDPARLAGATCDEAVAWCRRVGGAVAIALAFARLAAIAAATLLFLAGFGVEGTKTAAASSGFGHAFSNCFRATESRPPSSVTPRSRQMPSKTQKQMRAFSRTAGLGSASAFFKDFSKISSPPEVSIACLDRWP